MSVFDGKWKKISSDNVAQLVKEIVGDDAAKAARATGFLDAADAVEELTVTDEGVDRKSYINGQMMQEFNTKFGETVEKQTIIGTSMVKGTRVSDSRIEVTEDAEGRSGGHCVISVDGNQMTFDYTVNDVTCRRVFEKME